MTERYTPTTEQVRLEYMAVRWRLKFLSRRWILRSRRVSGGCRSVFWKGLVMSRFDGIVSAEAWGDLVVSLRDRREGSDEPLEDFEIAEIVRQKVYEVEGEDI